MRHLCKDGRVLGLHHGVDDGLRVDDNLNVIIGGAVEVVRLDDLQALIHERRAVAGDLGSHAAQNQQQSRVPKAAQTHAVGVSQPCKCN